MDLGAVGGRLFSGGDTDQGSLELLPQQQESDHRTSSEMIAEIMDSEEKMKYVLFDHLLAC